jgi:hypothetical protein
MRFPNRQLLSVIPLIINCLVNVSCGKKGQIEYETAQLKLTLGEETAILKKLQAESLAVGHLGYYNNPQPDHIKQLKDRLKAMREETATLIADRDKKAKEVSVMKRELETYRSRYF